MLVLCVDRAGNDARFDLELGVGGGWWGGWGGCLGCTYSNQRGNEEKEEIQARCA
jgi:hypothetical protein